MYGLPQARILAQDLLVQRMAKHGYMQSKIVPGLWMHNKHNTTFTLVINDFGIKCTSKVDAHHIIDALNFNTIGAILDLGHQQCLSQYANGTI